MTTDELVTTYDKTANGNTVGFGFYLDELQRREAADAMRASDRLAKAAVTLTATNTVLAIVAIVIALLN